MDLEVSAWYGALSASQSTRKVLILAGALAALVPALVMWGFTVDDALIPIRYAHHLGQGAGYRFNVGGESTDGVTPLPWAPLLVPLASPPDFVVVLERVKVIGIVVWTITGALLGHALAKMAKDRRDVSHAGLALVVVALAFPIGAWAGSGLETGFAMALTTLAAVSFDRPRRVALLAGVAASLRPELVVWAMILAAGSAIAHAAARRSKTKDTDTEAPPPPPPLATTRIARAAIVPVLLAFAPFLACALVRLVAFGRAAPLAVLAKPSDFTHGWVYAGAALVVVLTPILSFAPLVIMRKASPQAKTIALAAAIHLIVIIAVGGDWMPYARLMVPVAPSLAIVFVDVSRFAHVAATGLRTFLALSIGVAVAHSAAPAGRGVLEVRKELIATGRPELGASRVVAALDVGWVGAAVTADAQIVDLAGLTDPSIAVLRGGHTSKLIDAAMLLDRNVDTVVIYGQPRWSEEHLLHTSLFHRSYRITANIMVNGPGLYYAVYKRRGPLDDGRP